MSTRRRLRSAVIGMGFIGPNHVDAVRRGGYADVVVVADADAARAEMRANVLAVPAWTADIDALLSDPNIDVVHVCTPNATHVAFASAALEADKHVVVEKPMAPDVQAAHHLRSLARARGRHLMVAFTYRGYPQVRRARALVADGEAGDVRLVHGAYLQDWLSEPDDYNWRIDPAVGGASRAVADIGTHWFDLAEFVSGVRVTEVFADLATFIPVRYRTAQDTLAFGTAMGARTSVQVSSEDAATILLRFEGGRRGSFVVSQVSPGHRNDLVLEVGASRLSLAWQQESPERLWLGSRADNRIVDRLVYDQPTGVPDLPIGHPEGWAEAFRDVMRPFYWAVANDVAPDQVSDGSYPSADDGQRSVAFVEAVLRSSQSRRWEQMPTVESWRSQPEVAGHAASQ
jgi:predicted dehydrogenase